MAKATQVKTRAKAGATEILYRINHLMETGWRIDKHTQQRIAAHFIQKIVFKVNSEQVAVADVGHGNVQGSVAYRSCQGHQAWRLRIGKMDGQ